MGFDDFLKKAGELALETGKALGKSAMKQAQEIQELKEELQYESDDRLKYFVKHGSWKKKVAAASLLRERGYTKEDLEKLKNQN